MGRREEKRGGDGIKCEKGEGTGDEGEEGERGDGGVAYPGPERFGSREQNPEDIMFCSWRLPLVRS